MTVCLAAACRDPWVPGGTCWVLCVDGRLSGGAYGSDDTGIKFHRLGYNFQAMMAGHFDMARDLCGELQQSITRGSLPVSRPQFFSDIDRVCSEFCKGPLLVKGKCVHLLMTGFIGTGQLLAFIEIDEDGTYSVKSAHDYYGIGEGAFAALVLLNHRGVDALNNDVGRTLYTLYEAKTFSETVNSVGPKTRMKVHYSGTSEPISGELREYDIPQSDMELLEKYRTALFSFRPLNSRGDIAGLSITPTWK